MRFNCGRTYEERREDRDARYKAKRALDYDWHIVFAWVPIRVGSHDCRWLERVERRVPPSTGNIDYAFGEFNWEYRALNTWMG